MDPRFKKIVIIIAAIAIIVVVFLIIYFNRRLNVTVTSNPKEAQIIINNDLKISPAQYKLKPGTYTIWGAKDGYNEFKQNFKISKNNQEIQINLTPESQTDIPKEGAPTSAIPENKIKDLPFSNDHFKVSWDSAYGKYLIIPNIPFTFDQNPKDQIKNNWNQYVQYGQEALAWIRQQGVMPTNDNIEWWQQEFWPDGASIPIK